MHLSALRMASLCVSERTIRCNPGCLWKVKHIADLARNEAVRACMRLG
jgi:hypothetical protein